MNDWKVLRRYLRAEKQDYAALAKARPATAFYLQGLDKWLRRTRRSWSSLDAQGIRIPDTFLTPYGFSKELFLTDDFENMAGTGRMIYEVAQLKYQLRGHNILRELDRWATLMPEVLDPKRKYSILELSSGGCGGAEVASYFGNDFQATEFTQGRGSAYTPIHDALGLSVIEFDGTKIPYPFADNSHDIVICFQAIDAYGMEEDYSGFIDEMLRIARHKVAIIFNPGIRAKREKRADGYETLIKGPLEARYSGMVFSRCPSTGQPAVTIDPNSQS